MSTETPQQRVIDGMITNTSITWTQSVMTIEYSVEALACIVLIIMALIVLVLSLVFRSVACFAAGSAISVLIFLGIIRERSYCYEFDKAQREIKCKWGGFMWTSIGKGETTYFLNDVAYLEIQDIPHYRSGDTFKVKMVFKNGEKLDLPSESSLASCMEYANIYRDFLGLQTPIKGGASNNILRLF